MAAGDNTNVHKGHRQKVKQRYYEAGLDSMPDHNVLEMLLFFGIPYKDTNEIAHQLINRFGSFAGVLQANVEDLKKVKGMTDNAACLISMLLPVYKRYAIDLAAKRPTLHTTEEVVNYIKPKFVDTTNERLFALCFDGNHNLITDRLLSEGGLAKATFNLRMVASVVLETKASSIILVHNHPNSISMPSLSDVATTRKIIDLLSTLGVAVEDHIIVSDNGFGSMINMPKFAPMFYGLEDNVFD